MGNITLSDSIYGRVASFYGEDAVSAFAETAIEELLAWISAEQRPTSISEVETNRIYRIYHCILQDMLPTVEDIGQSFNLPMGRARYIVQNINYRHPFFMRKRRITAIIAALEKGEESQDGLPIANIPKACEEYLVDIATEMVLEGKLSTKPSRMRLSDGIRVELGARDREPLLKRLKEELSKLPQ
jgi:hypothetical protein